MTSSRARAARRRPNETSFPDGTCPDDRSRPSRDARTVNTSPSAQGLGVDTISLPAHTISSRNTSRSGSPSDQRSCEIGQNRPLERHDLATGVELVEFHDN